ncbi:MAG: translocation/assembly module TamB domain-containing protein [Bacteroidota bacterium]
MEKDNSKEKGGTVKKRSLGQRLLRGFLWLLLIFVVLIGSITLLFRNESFQNYATDWVVAKLSKDLNSNVELKHINFEIFDKLVLDSLLLEDQFGDTLLFSEQLVVNFNSGLYSLVQSNLEVSDITLQNARLNIRRIAGQRKSNLSEVLAKLIPAKKKKKSKKEKKPFYLEADKIYLDNVTFENYDEIKGERLNIFVKKGVLEVDEINLEENLVIVESANFEDSYVQLDNFKKQPLPALIDTTRTQAIKAPSAVMSDSLKQPFQLMVNHFDFGNGKFSLHNYRKAPVKTTPPEELDWDHLEVYNINIAIDSFEMSALNFKGKLEQLSAQDSSGFVLENLSAPKVKISSKRTELYGVNIVTPFSNVRDTIIFKYRAYPSFKDFENKVNMDLRLDKSYVAVKDVLTFAPKLKRNQFFVDNADEVIKIDGFLKGRVNNLRGNQLKLVLGKNTIIEGDFSSRDLAVKGSEMLNFGLKRLKTNVRTLRQLVPSFNPPTNFDKLGNINFTGRFDGFFVDFVAYGDLKTDLGSAKMDMRLDLKDGRKAANYTGNLNLLNFDLATWSGNSDFGNITVTSTISEGKGLTGKTAEAKLDANVDSFTFRGYTYNDFKMDGQLSQNSFEGEFIIKDENIDFSFNGSVDYSDSIPEFDFQATVNTLNLDELNLAKDDLGISGEMSLNIRDVNVSNLTGNANFRKLVLQRRGDETYTIDTLSFSSDFIEQGKRIFAAESEIFKGKIEGNYDIQEIPDAFKLFIEKNHPEIADRLGITSKKDTLKSTDFAFDIKIIDSKNFTHLLDPKLDTIKNLLVKGNYDGIDYGVNIDLDVEEITYDNIEIGGIKWNSQALRNIGQLTSVVPFYSILNGKNYIPEISIDGSLDRDTVVFDIGLSGERKTFDRFHIGGKIYFADGGFNISLANDSLVLFGEKWDISPSNFIQLKKRILETDNFVLRNRNRKVLIEDLQQKGIHIRLDSFNTGFIDSIWNYRQLDFAGNYSVDIEAKDIYNLKNFEAKIESDTFWVNGDDWGDFKLKANLADLKSQLDATLTIERGLRELSLDGFYILPSTKKLTTEDGEMVTNKAYQPNYFNFKLDLLNYPLNIAEYFIGDHTSDTEGLVDLEAKLTGFPKKIDSEGFAKIYKGAITVNYLNTRYFFGQNDPTYVKINNSLFDFSGNTLTDKYGNVGYASGGITHTHLRYPGLNARLYSNRILVLDTDKTNNPLYYGHGIGQVDAKFNGLFQKTNVEVNATTGKGTELFIPITTSESSSEISFIEFIDREAEEEETAVGREVRGMETYMNINMTEDAEVSLIFDERAGDIIKGNGNGPLQMVIPRSGDITLDGEYVIAEGDYLFTIKEFLINKKFKIERGGTINWTGDPFGAIINLDANYDRLRTSVYNFIQEYIELGDDNLKSSARKPTDVDLKMNLSGDLLQPDINFDLVFPRLVTGSVKNYVDTKLRVLRQDQSEMNRQVFGLIVIGGFLPTGQESLAGDELATSGINTVSEYLSQRLSIYLTSLLTEVFSDAGFISGVDFGFKYNIYEGGELSLGTGNEPVTLAGSEMEVNFNPRFLNDRLTVDGSVIRSTETTSGTFIGGDFIIEYAITDDRRFKVRFYQRSEQDLDGSRRDRTGLGINYRRQFNTFGEFIQGMKKAAKEATPKPNG